YKGNREMTMCELYYAERHARAEFLSARKDFIHVERDAVSHHLLIGDAARKTPVDAPAAIDLSGLYCRLIHLVGVKTAGAQTLQHGSSTPLIGTTVTPAGVPRAGDRPATFSAAASSTAPAIATPVTFTVPTSSPQLDAAALRLSEAVAMMD